MELILPSDRYDDPSLGFRNLHLTTDYTDNTDKEIKP
jgi:hypothetical protein